MTVDAMQFRTFTTDDPIELRTTGPLAVNVDNFAGDVIIKADPMAEATVVEDEGGLGLRTELSALAGGRAFYRVVGPLPQP